MVSVASWGRLGRWEHDVLWLDDRHRVADVIASGRRGLAFGMGRSYGDVCLNPGGVLWDTTGLDHFIAFDADTGRVACEAGVLLRDIQRMAVPRGWMLPVTPGTQLVTVGGAIANDVHGKNHPRLGSFGNHVTRLQLARTSGDLVDCGPELRPDWFRATVGGLGLTGVIVNAEIQLRRVPGPWLDGETVPFGTLDEFLSVSRASEAPWEYTVAWIDCIGAGAGRGLFMRANHTERTGRRVPSARQRTVPLEPPVSLVNGLSLRPFNFAYYHAGRLRAGRSLAHYERFFYPLDGLHQWNRMYGPRGFYQYQCAVPEAAGAEAVAAMLREISASGEGSFLAVLKAFGHAASVGMLSFPMPGLTLALDFPNRGERTLRLFERLDAMVAQAGGRLYAAKDARMPRALFEQGYPGLGEFLAYRDAGISSAMSRRLLGS